MPSLSRTGEAQALNFSPATVAVILPSKPIAVAVRLNNLPWPSFGWQAWTNSCAKMSRTRIESLIVGEMKISAWLSADALADQHSPILRFLLERADFEGKPQLERTSKGKSTPCCLNRLLSSVVASESQCSLVFVIIFTPLKMLIKESFFLPSPIMCHNFIKYLKWKPLEPEFSN